MSDVLSNKATAVSEDLERLQDEVGTIVNKYDEMVTFLCEELSETNERPCDVYDEDSDRVCPMYENREECDCTMSECWRTWVEGMAEVDKIDEI